MITIIALIGIMGLGYAFLHSDLKINGVSTIPASSWNVRFKDSSIQVTTGSVAIDTENNEQAARIDDDTNLSYKVRLALPGDFYEFTVVVENTGSIDAMIDSISSKLGDTEITTGTLPSYLNYSVAYADGVSIGPKQILAKNTEETLKVRLEFKKDIQISELPSAARTLNLNFQINYVQADDTATSVPRPVSFADDSWDTIISAAQSGNTSVYTVGSTKEVDLGTFGTHMLRVANNSTPAECATEGFSQTAFGFVLEFADIITTHRMNPFDNTDSNLNGTVNGTGNKGGWEYSEMRTYVNTDIYNALPATLKNAIIDTTVVSGYGQNDSANFITVDKLYLLSQGEVEYPSLYDKASDKSRRLDYYVDNNDNRKTVKFLNGKAMIWWLRSANSSSNYYFFVRGGAGEDDRKGSLYSYGCSPAFRIA